MFTGGGWRAAPWRQGSASQSEFSCTRAGQWKAGRQNQTG